jgi:hypothetical protein
MVQVLAAVPRRKVNVAVAAADPDTDPKSGLVELKLIELGDTDMLLITTAAAPRVLATVRDADLACPQPRTAAIVSAIRNWIRRENIWFLPCSYAALIV